jgi:hypothetical protein
MKTKTLSIIFIFIAFGMILGSCTRQSELEGSWEGCNIRRPLIDWTLDIKGNRFCLVREDSNEWYIRKETLEKRISNKKCRISK